MAMRGRHSLQGCDMPARQIREAAEAFRKMVNKPKTTPEQQEQWDKYGEITELAAWCAARAYSEAIPYPCQKCGTPVVDVSNSDGGIDVQCPACGWIPVEVVEINGVPV